MSKGVSFLQQMVIKLLAEKGEKTIHEISAKLLEKPCGSLTPSLTSLWRSLRSLEKRGWVQRVSAHYVDTHHPICRWRMKRSEPPFSREEGKNL